MDTCGARSATTHFPGNWTYVLWRRGPSAATLPVMRPPVLLAALTAALMTSAAPALADTTFTQTVTPGGSFRTAEGPPTEATPLIISGTISNCSSGCPAGPITLTVTFHGDEAGDVNGPEFEGESNELAPAGRAVDVSLSGADVQGQRAVGVASITFDVDKSQLYPGFTGLGGHGVQLGSLSGPFGKTPKAMYGRQSQWAFGPICGNCDPALAAKNEKLGDGDLRLTKRADVDPGFAETNYTETNNFWLDASFLPVQPWGKATISSSFWVRDELPDALRHGVPVSTRSYYHCDLDIDLVVSSAVAHQLHLKSTTIGSKHFDPACDGRVPINARAKRALRKYKKVVGKVTVTSHNVDGTKTVKSTRLELTKPDSELE